MAKPSEFADLGHVIEQQKSPKSSATIDAQLEEILTDALSIIRQELGMTIGFIAQFSGGRRVIKVSDTSENKPVLKVGDSDLLENTYCQRVVDGRFPNLINDALTFPDARELQITAELSIRAYASAPCSGSMIPDTRVGGNVAAISEARCPDSLESGPFRSDEMS